MRLGHVWFGMAGGVRHCGVWLGAVRRGKAGKVGSGCVSYGELSSGLLRYGMAGKARLGLLWLVETGRDSAG